MFFFISACFQKLILLHLLATIINFYLFYLMKSLTLFVGELRLIMSSLPFFYKQSINFIIWAQNVIHGHYLPLFYLIFIKMKSYSRFKFLLSTIFTISHLNFFEMPIEFISFLFLASQFDIFYFHISSPATIINLSLFCRMKSTISLIAKSTVFNVSNSSSFHQFHT